MLQLLLLLMLMPLLLILTVWLQLLLRMLLLDTAGLIGNTAAADDGPLPLIHLFLGSWHSLSGDRN